MKAQGQQCFSKIRIAHEKKKERLSYQHFSSSKLTSWRCEQEDSKPGGELSLEPNRADVPASKTLRNKSLLFKTHQSRTLVIAS